MKTFFNKFQSITPYFYMFFVIVMAALNSATFNSTDKIYKIGFVLGLGALGIKLLFTRWRFWEVVAFMLVGALLANNFFQNGEKTLIITYLAILGAKDVDTNKLFKYGFWVKLVVTVVGIVLVLKGIIPYETKRLPKLLAGEETHTYIELPLFGFDSPNGAFHNILSIVMLAVLAYREKIKLWMYFIFTAIMAVAYKIFMCRTGLLIWGGFLFVLLIYWAVRKTNVLRKVYEFLLCTVPAVMAALTYFLAKNLSREDMPFIRMIDNKLTGRLTFIERALPNGITILNGHIPSSPFDNAYFMFLYNYGLIISIILWGVYTYAMVYAVRKNHSYMLIYMAAIAVQCFMEFNMISVVWNIAIIYLGTSVFDIGMKKTDGLVTSEQNGSE